MNAKEALNDFASKVDKEIERIISDEKIRVNGTSPIITEVIENLPAVCFGGKRLRGALLTIVI